ncbi:hypothetical protein SAMN04487981_103233 [Streptomyces sp. cf386]|nr:hypothetical protein SAMN04487981_103233 [Streptomyces sp. cf386]
MKAEEIRREGRFRPHSRRLRHETWYARRRAPDEPLTYLLPIRSWTGAALLDQRYGSTRHNASNAPAHA